MFQLNSLFGKKTNRLFESVRQKAIIFKPVFPPRHEEVPACFFGGNPRLPAGLEWPRIIDDDGPEWNRSLSFLAQIDCASLPRIEQFPDMPEKGTLFFFVDFMDELCLDHDDFSNWVIYCPEPTFDNPETANPDDLQHLYLQGPEYFFQWLEFTDRTFRDYPRNFPKWAMSPHEIDVFSILSPYFSGLSTEERRELGERMDTAINSEFERLGGPPAKSYSNSVHLIPKDAEYERVHKVWTPEGFPQAWINVEITAGLICREIRKMRDSGPKTDPDGNTWPPDPEALKRAYEDVFAQASNWIDRARGNGLFSALADSERSEFVEWLRRLNSSTGDLSIGRIYDKRSGHTLNRCIVDGYLRGVDYCLAHSAEAAAIIDEKTLEFVRWKHSLLRDRHGILCHSMLGAAKNIQSAPERMKKSHILLMQFDSDYGMDWMWGDLGVLQYWITPEDLKKRQFDKVVVTMEGG